MHAWMMVHGAWCMTHGWGCMHDGVSKGRHGAMLSAAHPAIVEAARLLLRCTPGLSRVVGGAYALHDTQLDRSPPLRRPPLRRKKLRTLRKLRSRKETAPTDLGRPELRGGVSSHLLSRFPLHRGGGNRRRGGIQPPLAEDGTRLRAVGTCDEGTGRGEPRLVRVRAGVRLRAGGWGWDWGLGLGLGVRVGAGAGARVREASQALCVRRKSLAVVPPDEKQMRRMEGWRPTSACTSAKVAFLMSASSEPFRSDSATTSHSA